MAKPTNEELQAELEQVVTEYNKAVETQGRCKNRIIAVQAVLEDRKPEETVVPE